MMRADVKRLSEAEIIGPTDRQTAAIDKVRAMSRRSQALLAAAGQSESALHWYVIRTDAHAEIDVDNLLGEANVEHWLPFMKVTDRRRGGRKKEGREPVRMLAWPGYMFVRVDPSPEAWAGLRTVKGIVGILGAGEKPFPVKHEKVLQLQVFLEGSVIAIGEIAKQLKVGETVRVNQGPFATHNGIVSELCEDGRARVEVMLFGRAVPITLGLDEIDKG
ncbi:transcriptional antiterminator NusG [Mesorhizobium sp. YC-39]|uniref:transcription termination/antitermination protein NusG n=1 Tax=unclassified Mesorhizobium TaxID=325217 RepID=UPI0021E95CB3|nr:MULTISPECIES: transcription termination/antitermination protein NusG [unclassified Mesorhizobium]MCV3209617.1 transcriptional antiterminator NusG [Mesorhizobium sp. YC-2]MCV3230147.1 transcriptional antiterminator NusG [Mesorhizobium sp. YC-39]